MSIHNRLIRSLKTYSIEEVDWEAVYNEQMPKAYNFFRFLRGDRMVAEDLTSETFVKAWRFRNRYLQDRASISTWLFSIARNVAKDHYRKYKEIVSIENIEISANEPGVEHQIEALQDFAHLYRLLAQLSAREQELIALKYGADLNNREIARLTKLSESNVGSILHRSICKLRKQWEVDL
jgi:RNA polymerase sigma-70 factor, ECF subfamily